MGGITLTRRGVLLLAPVLALLIIISTLGPSKLPDPVSLYYTGWRTSSSSSSSSPDTTIQNLDLVREQVQEQELPHLLSGTYRERLEASSNRFIPSQTLSFDKIFVLSLPKRIERRERMTKLAKALELKFEFILATPKESNVIDWIGERIYQIRLLKRACIAKATGMAPESIGGGGPESPWLLGDDVKLLELPSLRDQNDGGKIWTDLLREDKVEGLRSPIGFNTNQALYDPIEPNPRRQVDSAVISTYYNHMRVLQAVVKEGLGSALILEDDVDLEWDLDRLWANIHRRLPSDWDTVFLGSCWGREYERTSRPFLYFFFRELMRKNRTGVSPSGTSSIHRTKLLTRLRRLPFRRPQASRFPLRPLDGLSIPHRYLHTPTYRPKTFGIFLPRTTTYYSIERWSF